MNISTHTDDGTCTFAVQGRIDTLTAPELEQAITENAPECDKMVFDLKDVDYISSAGLRVILLAHREMKQKGGLTLKGLNPNIRAIMMMTGFHKVLQIEES